MYTEKVGITECIKMTEVMQVMEDRCAVRWASIREQEWADMSLAEEHSCSLRCDIPVSEMKK